MSVSSGPQLNIEKVSEIAWQFVKNKYSNIDVTYMKITKVNSYYDRFYNDVVWRWNVEIKVQYKSGILSYQNKYVTVNINDSNGEIIGYP